MENIDATYQILTRNNMPVELYTPKNIGDGSVRLFDLFAKVDENCILVMFEYHFEDENEFFEYKNEIIQQSVRYTSGMKRQYNISTKKTAVFVLAHIKDCNYNHNLILKDVEDCHVLIHHGKNIRLTIGYINCAIYPCILDEK